MSSDNLLAGIAGFAQGFEKGFLPMVQNRQKMTLEEQLAQLQAKRDLEAKRTLATEQFGRDEQLQKEKSGLDLSRESAIEDKRLSGNQVDVPEPYRKMFGGQSKVNKSVYGPTLAYNSRENAATDKKKKINATTDKEIKLLKSTLSNFDDTMKLYDQAKGDSGVMGGMFKDATSYLSKGTLNPQTKAYNNRIKEFILTANKQLTGSSRGTENTLKAGVASIPEISEARDSAEIKKQNFRKLIVDRIKELSGEDSANYDSLTMPESKKPAPDPSQVQGLPQGAQFLGFEGE